MEPADPPLFEEMPERTAASASQPSPSWAASTVVILCAAFFVGVGIQPQAPAYRQVQELLFHNWISMAVCAVTLVFVRRGMLGPLPSILRILSGVLLPLFVIFGVLGLLIWPPLWEMLRPLGIVEGQARPAAIGATIAIGWIACALLMLRVMFRWIRNVGRRYERAGFAVGFGPLYFYFRRRRAPQ